MTPTIISPNPGNWYTVSRTRAIPIKRKTAPRTEKKKKPKERNSFRNTFSVPYSIVSSTPATACCMPPERVSRNIIAPLPNPLAFSVVFFVAIIFFSSV